MATIKVCDRCGARINPPSSRTFLRLDDYDGAYNPYNKDFEGKAFDLCASCALKLRVWLEDKKH